MNGPDETCYRGWDRQKDSAWFTAPQPTRQLLEDVQPLTEEYAARLWHWVFPTKHDVLPLVAKDPTGWLKDVFADGLVPWDGPLGDPLLAHFNELGWADDDIVFYLVRRGCGYQTRWHVYREHWKHFLGWYDEGLLLHPTAREVAVFWENGRFVGRRSKRRISMKRGHESLT